MSHYSPLGATYGIRVERFLETAEDFDKYHGKLNRKLQKLRHHCRLTTKDTKRYSTKEKYSKISSDDYDTKNKLFGTLMLLHAERDLVLVESLKLNARQRGSLKKSEKKVISTRLKKACKTTEQLLALTRNESDVFTRAEYLIYHKLSLVSYYNSCKPSKTRYTDVIVKELSLVFTSLQYLQSVEKVNHEIADIITSQFEYMLRQYAGAGIFSSKEMRSFIAQNVSKCPDDPLVQLLVQNGFEMPEEDVEMEESEEAGVKKVHWRRFSASVRDSKVAKLISEAMQIVPADLSQYSSKLVKWQEASDAQKNFIEQRQDDDRGEDAGEDNEILMTYIQYNLHFTTIERDNILFQRLWAQWNNTVNKSRALRVTKYKEIERIVHNLTAYLQEVMDLPGVYSDDILMANLKLAMAYYQIHLTAGCLASFYKAKQRYLEALALYVNGQKSLEAALQEADLSEALPGAILSEEKVKALQSLIKTSLRGVISLAEYEKVASPTFQTPLKLSLIEKLGKPISPADVSLMNLFPTRPIIRPIASKPTLFDLAFNYITYEDHDEQVSTPASEEVQPSAVEGKQDVPKKKGLFGLFGL